MRGPQSAFERLTFGTTARVLPPGTTAITGTFLNTPVYIDRGISCMGAYTKSKETQQ